MKKNRLLVLVDESNVIFSSSKDFKRNFDWLRFRDYLVGQCGGGECQLVEMVIYVGLPPATQEWAERRQAKLGYIHWLRSQGFLVYEKNGQPRPVGYKADVAVRMAIDAIDLTRRIMPDMVVLVTGDADFAHLALTIRREGIEVLVASVPQTLASELRTAANGFIDLTELFLAFDPVDGPAPTPAPAP